MAYNKEKKTTKVKDKEITFTVVFNENGESFQAIMNKILINKLSENQ